MKQKEKRGGIARKALSVVASASLAVSLMPSVALASAGSDTNGGWFDLPTEQVTSFVHKDGSSYLSSGIERVVGGFSQSMYYLMGINGVNFDRAIRPGNQHAGMGANGGKYVTDAVNAAAGIMGTSVNHAPDEYLWNSLYRLGQGQELQSVKGEEDMEVHINAGNIRAYETVNVTVGGTEYAMPVPIYHEANFISSTDTEWTNSKSIASWVAIENQREGRPNTAAYDPYIASWTTNSGGINFGVELMYKLADAVDKVNAASNGKLTSRYVSSTDTDASMYKSAKDLATNYENFAKATQWYMIEQLAKNPEKKKVVAILCGYQPAKDGKAAAYACRVFDTGTDEHDSANYGGRLRNSLMNISTDINTVLSPNDVAFSANDADKATNGEPYVRWYTAEQIVQNADAVFVCDAPYGNDRAFYLATNEEGTKASIYTVDNNSFDKTNENVEPLVAAATAEGAKATLFYKYPDHLFGVWYAQGFENCWMAPLGASLLYANDGLFPNYKTVMSYAARKFWHINEADVDGVIKATCHDVSLPAGQTLDTMNAADYVSKVEAVMSEGVTYYNSNKAAIDAMNNGDIAKYDTSAMAGTEDAAMTDKAEQASASSDKPVTVTFDPDNGQATTTQVIDSGKVATEPAAPTKSGFTFEGWSNGSAKFDFATALTADVTLKAQWKKVESTTPAEQAEPAKQAELKANTLTVKAKTVKVSKAKVKKAKQTIAAKKAFKVAKNQGAVTFKKTSGSKKITVASNGKITVKKGLKKGNYKIGVDVTAAGNSNYAKGVKSVTVTVKVA